MSNWGAGEEDLISWREVFDIGPGLEDCAASVKADDLRESWCAVVVVRIVVVGPRANLCVYRID